MTEKRPPAEEAALTHCEFCGADWDPASPPSPRVAATPPPEPEGAEPATHCEFCGAEYPVPGEGSG